MDYEDSLKELQKSVVENNVEIKYVPGKKESGWFSDDTRKELENMFANNPMFQNKNHQKGVSSPNQDINIQVFRDGMGAPHKNVAKHDLLIDNTILNGSITCRTYVRTDLKDQILPALIYVHGGAYYGGSMIAVDDIARAFADFGPYRVYNLEYPLAPEHPYPAALLTCYNALNYLYDHVSELKIDPAKIYMSGDSAGGNLTISTAYLDHAIFNTNYLTRIVLYYPGTTNVSAQQQKLADPEQYSFKEMGKQLSAFIKFFGGDTLAAEAYCGNHSSKEHLISPLNADHLEKMPPSELIVGEFDPLRFQGEVFINKLKEKGVSTYYVRYNGMSHAFLDSLGYYPQAEDSIKEACKFLNN